jgi:hypothetical protein
VERAGVRPAALAVLTGALLVAAPAAHADTHYGGAAVSKGRPAGPYTALVRKDDGRIVMRITSVFQCRKEPSGEFVARLTGRTPDGAAFTASGRTRLDRRVLRFTAPGTLTADAVTGTVRLAGCSGYPLRGPVPGRRRRGHAPRPHAAAQEGQPLLPVRQRDGRLERAGMSRRPPP